MALGRLQPAGGIIELGGVPGDKVEDLQAYVGKPVNANDVLLTFDSRRLRQLELDATVSQLTEATNRLKAEQNYADALIREAQAGLDLMKLDELELAAQTTRIKSLELQAETAARNYERVAKVSEAVASGQQRDQLKLLKDQAANELAAAQDQLKQLAAGIELKKKQSQAKYDQAVAGRGRVDSTVPLESLGKAVAAAEEKLKLAWLKSPLAGSVLEVLCDKGDVVGQMPLVRLADSSKMIVLAEVYETQVLGLREGMRATATADALPKPLTGTVEKIGSVVGKNRILSIDPRQNSDARVVEVRIALDDSTTAARLVGLQVTVAIDAQNAK